MRLQLFEVVAVREWQTCWPDDVGESYRLFEFDQRQIFLLVIEDFLDSHLDRVAFVPTGVFVPCHEIAQTHRRNRPEGFAVVHRRNGCHHELLGNQNAFAEWSPFLSWADVVRISVNEHGNERNVVANPLSAVSNMERFLRRNFDYDCWLARHHQRLNRFVQMNLICCLDGAA